MCNESLCCSHNNLLHKCQETQKIKEIWSTGLREKRDFGNGDLVLGEKVKQRKEMIYTSAPYTNLLIPIS